MSRDLNDTLIFVRVVEQGSFIAAARALALPKTTVSRRVQLLEARLGAKLLKRTTRRIGLTEAGELYYERSKRFATDLEDAEAAVGELHGEPRGWLRVTAPYTLAINTLARLTPEFLTLYPEIRLEIVLTNDRLDLVSSNVDLALRVGPLADSTLGARCLGGFTSHVYASTRYIERHGTPATPAELDRHRILAHTFQRQHDRYVWQLGDDGGMRDFNVSPVFVANDPAMLRLPLLSGLGLAVLSDQLTLSHLAEGSVQRVMPAWRGPCAALNVVYPPGRTPPRKVRAFVDFLAERLELDDAFNDSATFVRTSLFEPEAA